VDKEKIMGCQIILMDVNNNHAFEVDEVVDVLKIGVNPGTSVIDNPKFKIIQSDIDYDEAQSLLEPEYDIFKNAVKNRSKTLYTRDLLQKELNMDRQEVVNRVVVKEPETSEQAEDMVVG
jgi:hypothetical protein